jgi:type IV pilus assembly protein PilW
MKSMNRIYQQGFSLLEVFVALAIGLVIFAGVLSIFVGMRTTTTETSAYGELQENGRFAISLLTNDISKQDFWGDYTGTFDLASINHTLGNPGNDCTGAGVNNSSFPLAVGNFRTLWGETVSNADPMGCFDDAKIGSDLIQLKRVLAAEIVKADGITSILEDPAEAAPAGNYHLVTNSNNGILFGNGVVPTVDNSRVWQYQHHVYYVREESQGNNTVPVLMQGQLTNSMTFSPIIDGIEMIRFMYGYDADTDPDSAGYGIVDGFISADDMTASSLWDNPGGTKIIAIKVYVLARSTLPDNKYTDTNTYQLGDLSYTPAGDDQNYRRLLFSSTVTLYNARVDSW